MIFSQYCEFRINIHSLFDSEMFCCVYKFAADYVYFTHLRLTHAL